MLLRVRLKELFGAQRCGCGDRMDGSSAINGLESSLLHPQGRRYDLDPEQLERAALLP